MFGKDRIVKISNGQGMRIHESFVFSQKEMEDEFGDFSSPVPVQDQESDLNGSFGSFTSPLHSLAQENSSQIESKADFRQTTSPTEEDVHPDPIQEAVRDSKSSQSSLTQRLSLVSTEISQNTRVSVSMPVVESQFTSLPTVAWTDPNLFYNVVSNDSISIALNKNFSYSELPPRKLKTVEDALANSKDQDPFLTLVQGNSWTSIANLAKHALISCHPNQIQDIMRLWVIRLSALYKLGLADVMELELGKLGDLNAPQYQYENYKDLLQEKKSGSMVSMEIKILSCLIHSIRGDHNKTLNLLYKLLYEYRLQTQGFPRTEWMISQEFLLKVHIMNCLLRMDDTLNALNLLESLSVYYVEYAAYLYSAMGRLHLSLGDVHKAKILFDKVHHETSCPHSSYLTRMNMALYWISKRQWEEAFKILKDMPHVSGKVNASIVLLYQGFSKKAVSLLEGSIKENPFKISRSNELIFNLCTMYDLLDSSTDRKKDLLKNVLAKFASEDFKLDSIKI